MSYPGMPGSPPAPPAPHGAAYQLSPQELRHPQEIPVMIASWAAVAVLLVLLGAAFNVLIQVAVVAAIIGATLYFTAISKVADAIQVGPQQFPQLHQAVQEAAWRLSMPAPAVYIDQNPLLQADAMDVGARGGFVSLSTALVEAMTPAELQFAVARQLGHIKCRHTSWSILHKNSAGGILGVVGSLFRTGLMVIFSWWNRTVVLTADRAGLIGGQDIRAAITCILKEMVGPQVFDRLNIPHLLQQLEELEGNAMARVAQAAGLEAQPFALNRIRELLRFYKSPQYQSLAARQGKAGTTMLQHGQGLGTSQLFHVLAHQAQGQRDAAQPAAAARAGAPAAPAQPTCRQCGQPLRSGGRFCGACGAPQG